MTMPIQVGDKLRLPSGTPKHVIAITDAGDPEGPIITYKWWRRRWQRWDYDAVPFAMIEQLCTVEPGTPPDLRSQREKDLESALNVAMAMLSPGMPGDSRAAPDWFVACAAVQCGLEDGATREVLSRAEPEASQ